MVSIILDVAVIFIIILSTFFGYRKGLAKVLFKLFSFIIAVVLMFILYKPISNVVINETSFDEDLKNEISIKLNNTNIETGEILKDNGDYPEIVVEYVNKYVKQAVDEGKSNVIEYVSEKLSIAIINIAVAISLFIIINLGLLILEIITRFVVKIPVISQVDKLGGIVFGIFRGILIIYVILAITSLCSAFLSEIGILQYIQSSKVTKYMYNNNVILKIIA